MRIAIFSAIPQEIAALRSTPADLRTEPIADGLPLTLGTLHGHEIGIAEAGIGKVNMAMVATAAFEHFRPEVALFTGVAGGVDPALAIGDVVIGALVIQHDAGVDLDGRFEVHQAGHVPFFNPSDRLGFRPSPALLETARRSIESIDLDPFPADAGGPGRPPHVSVGTIVTGDRFVAGETARSRLFEDFGAQAVEMEGGALAQVAEHYGVDHLVIRSLSDLAGADSDVEFGVFLPRVAENSLRVVDALLEAL